MIAIVGSTAEAAARKQSPCPTRTMSPRSQTVPTPASHSPDQARSATQPSHDLLSATLVIRGGLEVLTWPSFSELGFEAVVTTRRGGASTPPYDSLNLALHLGDDPNAVIANRVRAASTLGDNGESLVFADQVHGATPAVVGSAQRGRGLRRLSDAVPQSDSLVTSDPRVILVVLVADCSPVVLFDPEARVLGCAHSGWRGALSGVLEGTVGAMGELGATPGRIVAGIGPTIGSKNYQVGEEVVEAATRKLGDSVQGLLEPDQAERHLFDLREANRRILVAAGIPSENIHLTPMTTGPGGPFFSDRAEHPCGRFGLFARILP